MPNEERDTSKSKKYRCFTLVWLRPNLRWLTVWMPVGWRNVCRLMRATTGKQIDHAAWEGQLYAVITETYCFLGLSNLKKDKPYTVYTESSVIFWYHSTNNSTFSINNTNKLSSIFMLLMCWWVLNVTSLYSTASEDKHCQRQSSGMWSCIQGLLST